jgi:hypothetical protein
MNILAPLCTNCNGTGMDGGSTPDPLCKGTGRKALDERATALDWVRWIREQPDAKHGVEVLNQMFGQDKAPDGFAPVRLDEAPPAPVVTAPVTAGNPQTEPTKDPE